MFDLPAALVRLLAILPALTLHEFAHAYSAYKFGDPTPRLDGRVSLNPLAHLDPIGTLMILFAPIGWAKPVRVNPYNFRDPARHLMMSTACGPLANIAQGVVWGLMLRFYLMTAQAITFRGNLFIGFLAMVTLINFILALFNLIPLGPLDGHEVLAYFLPYESKVRYETFNRRYGTACLLGLIMVSFLSFPILGYLVFLPANTVASLIAGVDCFGLFYLATS